MLRLSEWKSSGGRSFGVLNKFRRRNFESQKNDSAFFPTSPDFISHSFEIVSIAILEEESNNFDSIGIVRFVKWNVLYLFQAMEIYESNLDTFSWTLQRGLWKTMRGRNAEKKDSWYSSSIEYWTKDISLQKENVRKRISPIFDKRSIFRCSIIKEK